MTFTPSATAQTYPTTDARHWLLDDERDLYIAASCRDLTSSLDVSVKLVEYRGKRTPKKLTEEQEARESKASALIHDYARACDPGVLRSVLKRLAMERANGEVVK